MLEPAWRSYRSWWQRRTSAERVTYLILVLATVGAAILRLAFFRSNLQYLADQGRDVIIAYGILHGDIALVGPSTSVGSMFLGPLYYYFMAPFLLLSNFDPIGPALAVAWLGILTVPLIYWVGKRLVGPAPALIAALLYAGAPVVIEYTRFSWNPNPAPIVMLCLLYCVWRAWRGSAWWWCGAAAAIAVLSQLHYVALLAAAPTGLYWLADVVRSVRSRRQRLPSLGQSTLAAGLIILFSLLPLIVFNWRFDNLIWKGFVDFLNGDQDVKTVVQPLSSLVRSLRETQGRALQTVFEIWGKEWSPWYRQINISLLSGYVVVLAVGWYRFSRSRYRDGYNLLLAASLSTWLGLSWYRSSVFFHYFSFFFPVAYLLTGIVVVQLYRWFKWLGFVLAAVLLGYIGWLAARPENTLYLNRLGWQIDDVKRVAAQVSALVPDGKTYSLTELSALRDYRGLVYRYFLLKSNHPPVSLERSAEADYLVVIADDPRQPGDVLSSPVYEIAAFPRGDYRIVQSENGPWLYLISRSTMVE